MEERKEKYKEENENSKLKQAEKNKDLWSSPWLLTSKMDLGTEREIDDLLEILCYSLPWKVFVLNQEM